VLRPDRKQWQLLAVFSALGIEIPVAIATGALIGYGLDKYFHTQPWLLLLFTGFGIAAAAKGAWRELKKYQPGREKGGPGDSPSK